MKDYNFGNYLFRLRKANHLSQKELGKMLGVSDKAVSRWENGASKPRAALLVKLSAILDTTVDALMTGGKKSVLAGNSAAAISLHEGTLEDRDDMQMNQTDKVKMNFIPQKASPNGNYLCSWDRQAEVAKKFGITGEALSEMRDALNTQYLFNDPSLYHLYGAEFRSGLFFMLDDGWDVPYGSVHYGNEEFYGSMLPDGEKFKELGKTPLERLINMSSKIKELGYAGLGLWVSPNYGKTDENGAVDYDDIRRYWEDRAEMSCQADIKYWKVDWGIFMRDLKYREIMTESCHKKAPGLFVEHAYPCGVYANYNNPERPMDKALPAYFEYSDVFRTYDVHPPFEYTETLKRVDLLLNNKLHFKHNCKGYINVEWLSFIAAGLGLNLGIMHQNKEVEAALRWQRIAPPFGAAEAEYTRTEQELTDTHYFDHQPKDWIRFSNRYHKVSAPAIMARNTALPKVGKIGEHQPFVIASKSPKTGALAVAALPRTVDPDVHIKPLADVTVYPDSLNTLVGAFGVFGSLTLEYPENIPENVVVWAQAMLSDEAIDITERVTVDSNRLTIDGKDLRWFSKVNHDETETYEPSLIITIARN
jgi:transcriptional regulator with XRE-family HTH domain